MSLICNAAATASRIMERSRAIAALVCVVFIGLVAGRFSWPLLKWMPAEEELLNSNGGDGRWITCAGHGEGWYVPPSGALFAFSAAEAVRCLRRKRLVFAGDSYHMQTFIGLVETLSPKDRGAKEIQGSAERRSELARMQAVAKHLAPNEINLKFRCSASERCYGRGSLAFAYQAHALNACLACLQKHAGNADTIVVLSTGVHLISRWPRKTAAQKRAAAHYLVKEVERILRSMRNVIYASGPSYDVEKVPFPYNGTMSIRGTSQAALTLLNGPWASRVLDFYELTRSCKWDNCTTDGGHRARFVNRMKAQVLLNKICPTAAAAPTCDGQQ